MLAAVAFTAFRHSFLRHDAHSAAFFVALAVLLLGLPWGEARRAEACVAAGAALLLWSAAINVVPRDLVNPLASTRGFAARVGNAGSPQPALAAARDGLRTAYALSEPLVAALRERDAQALPADATAVWAAEGRWRPLHSPGDSAQAPERILRTVRPDAVDDPASEVELACRYSEVLRDADRHVLARGASRCGTPRLLRRVTVRTGQAVPVPRAAADELLLVTVSGLRIAGWERLRRVLWKPDERGLSLDDRVARVPPELDGRPLLVSIPPRLDFPAPLALAPPVRRAAVVISRRGAAEEPAAVDRTSRWSSMP
jgi:hypothetical protein